METVLRVIVVYAFVLSAFRLVGKRDLGSLSPFDFVVLMLIPEIFSPALTAGDYSLTTALIGGVTIFLLMYGTSWVAYRFKGARKLLEGEPSILVKHGKLCTKMLNSERVPKEEVLAEARKAGLCEIAEIEWAILEADGKISIIPMSAEKKTHGHHSSPV